MSSYEEGPSTGPAAADADPFPNLRGHRRRGLRVTTAAAVALGLAVGGGAVANAAGTGSTPSTSAPGAPFGHDGMHGTPPAAVGTVASVGTNTFTLTGRDGTTVTVDVGSTTTYVDPAVTSPSLADVKVGAHVAVFGTDSSNTVTATKVAIGGPGGPGGRPGFGGTPPAAVGTVASVGTNTFTLTGRDGTTVTVDVGSTTTYREVGVTSATIADVKVGSHVAVFGTESGSTVTATSVGIGMPGGPGGPGGPGDGDGDGPMGPAPSTGTGSSSTNAGVGSTSTSGSSVTA